MQGAVIRDERRKAVLVALDGSGERGLTVAGVIELTGIERRGCFRAVADLRDDGIITKRAGYWQRSSAGGSIMPPRIADLHRRWDETIIDGEVVETIAAAGTQVPPPPVEDLTNADARRAREAMDRLRSGIRQPKSYYRARLRQAPSKMPVAVRYADRLYDPSIAAEALNQGVWLIQGLADALRLDLVPEELHHRATQARLNLSAVERELFQAQAFGTHSFRAAIAASVSVITLAQGLLDEVRRFNPPQQLTAGPPVPESRGVTEQMMRSPADDAGFAAWFGERSTRTAARADARSGDAPEPWFRPADPVDRVAAQEVVRREQAQQRAAGAAPEEAPPAPRESYVQQHPVLGEVTRIGRRVTQQRRR